MDFDALVLDFEHSLLQVNRHRAAEIFDQCFHDGLVFSLFEKMVTQSLERIGASWEDGSVSLAQVYMSGVLCEELIDRYLPLTGNIRTDMPRMAIAVLQDHHALGKRIVYSVLRAAGFELMDFGLGLSVGELVRKTIDNNIEVLLISTLMLPSSLLVKSVRQELDAAGAQVKIIVGGAPFRLDSGLWARVGADADGKSASHVIDAIRQVHGRVV